MAILYFSFWSSKEIIDLTIPEGKNEWGIHRIYGLQEWERVDGFFDSLSGTNVGLKVGLIKPKKALN